MENILAITALLLSCYFLLCIFRPSGITEFFLVSFIIATACIVLWGYTLAAMNCLSCVTYWAIAGLLTAMLTGLVAYIGSRGLGLILFPFSISWSTTKRWFGQTFGNNSLYVNSILTALILTTVTVGAINLALVIFVAPHEWDSMTYHLPRMAHYLQQNNLGYFDADYWAQVVHPKNSTLLLLYTFLILGHNENLTQIIQYFSYWVVIISIYGVVRKTGLSRVQGIFSALVGSLLIDAVMQATTTQNDLILAAYFASTVYFLFAFRETASWKYLALAGLGIGLAIGTKASSLIVLPSVGWISLALTRTAAGPKGWFRNFSILFVSVLMSVCVFALPSGYVENYRLFGNPLGNADVRGMHTFAGKDAGDVVRGGAYNILRFGIDFLSLDGLPSIEPVMQMQSLLHFVPRQVLSFLNIDLESREATSFAPFEYYRPTKGGYWGILGFGLVWIMVFLSVFRVIKRPDFFLLSLAAVIFVISQAFSGPYDPSKGRYFAICMIFALPLVGVCLSSKNTALKTYLAGIVLLGCVSAISLALMKTRPVSSMELGVPSSRSIFDMDRIAQLTYHDPMYYRPYVGYEHLVPPNAKVAVFFYPNTFEYPLYGEYLTRTIMPINSFHRGLLQIPADAQFLMYANGYPCASPKDIHLGADWFIRVLADDNRECSAAVAPDRPDTLLKAN